MVELEAGSPVWRSQQRLKGAGQVHKHVAHQEKPAGGHTSTGRVLAATEARDLGLNAAAAEPYRDTRRIYWY